MVKKWSGTGLWLAVLLVMSLLQFSCEHVENVENAASSKDWKDWSETKPSINIRHVFRGEINRRGKPVGFHSTVGQPKNAQVNRIRSKPNTDGIYVAEVAIRRNAEASWQTKTSSMFPDKMNKEDVIGAILQAYNNSKKGTKFRGQSGLGFTIEGYLTQDRKRINTAYPIYTRE